MAASDARFDAEGRYRNDPHFRVLVDTLMALIAREEYTPSELRLALIFAATRHEQYRLGRPFVPHEKP